MKPVSGNWCWISRDRPDLRYALTHGWRFGIIFTTILIYLYVWWYLGRHFRSMVSTSDPLYETGDTNSNVVTSSIRKKQGFEIIQTPELEMDQFERPKPTPSKTPQNYSTLPKQTDMPLGQARETGPAGRLNLNKDEDEEADEQQTWPSESSRRLQSIEDKVEEEPRRKMSARISRFDNDDLDMSQASEARFSYLEQEEKLHQSATGGPSYLHRDMQPPTPARFSGHGMRSVAFGSNDKRGNKNGDSTLEWQLPASRELNARDFPLSPSLNNVQKQVPQNVTATMMSDFPIRKQTRKVEREIRRMMLLNAYPIMYVVLWIPGLVNRLMEASGNDSQSRVLAALQSSSQYIGLANAITYGFNQHVRHRIKGDLFRWMRRR
ncbi:uncharacterized protein ColSpa_07671 [Colletotrichum spaethianum]|uniref:Glucose receptor Git3 N-terminal domain-containing protein n=1 Tax=Colletotrichum spaethianum TaxID=700344 RepID=A0AA37UMZ5_9PEZI|nr:uncharacterized protein ColSpa_07671 [Colletotrichum spaethianum]GKT47490.1 hypothetical protein ColSpa_07671 [Colletotrichum spaethianum]